MLPNICPDTFEDIYSYLFRIYFWFIQVLSRISIRIYFIKSPGTSGVRIYSYLFSGKTYLFVSKRIYFGARVSISYLFFVAYLFFNSNDPQFPYINGRIYSHLFCGVDLGGIEGTMKESKQNEKNCNCSASKWKQNKWNENTTGALSKQCQNAIRRIDQGQFFCLRIWSKLSSWNLKRIQASIPVVLHSVVHLHCIAFQFFRVLQFSLLLCGDSCRNPIQSRYSRGYLSVSISKLRVKPYLSVL